MFQGSRTAPFFFCRTTPLRTSFFFLHYEGTDPSPSPANKDCGPRDSCVCNKTGPPDNQRTSLPLKPARCAPRCMRRVDTPFVGINLLGMTEFVPTLFQAYRISSPQSTMRSLGGGPMILFIIFVISITFLLPYLLSAPLSSASKRFHNLAKSAVYSCFFACPSLFLYPPHMRVLFLGFQSRLFWSRESPPGVFSSHSCTSFSHLRQDSKWWRHSV